MNAQRISASVTLHGFADLGLGGGNRPTVDLELEREGLTGREIVKALLQRFGERLAPSLGPLRERGCCLKNVYIFVNDKAVDDADEALGPHIDAGGGIRVLLILLKAIASG
jgi:hypothetical protein